MLQAPGDGDADEKRDRTRASARPEAVVRRVVWLGVGRNVRGCESRAGTGPLLQVSDRGVVRARR